MSEWTELGKALLELREHEVYRIVEERIKDGEDPLKIIEECNRAMGGVGERFEKGEYYISELVMSGEISKAVMKKLEPLLGAVNQVPTKGKIVIGTVKDDIHDIGKNIVVTVLKGHGFQVIDLGVNVPADIFTKTVKQEGARVLGLSALLNSTFHEMKNVVDELIRSGIRDQVKVIIGGSPCNEQVRQFTGADFYAKDAVEGARICEEIYQ